MDIQILVHSIVTIDYYNFLISLQASGVVKEVRLQTEYGCFESRPWMDCGLLNKCLITTVIKLKVFLK